MIKQAALVFIVFACAASAATYEENTVVTKGDATGRLGFGLAIDATAGWAVFGDFERNGQGAADLWELNDTSGVWEYHSTIASPSPKTGGQFGVSVTIAYPYVAVGAAQEDHGGVLRNGNVYVFKFDGSNWGSPVTLQFSSRKTDHRCGRNLAMTVDTLAVGCPRPGLAESRAFMFKRSVEAWNQEHVHYESSTTKMGESVDISEDGTIAVFGAPLETGGGNVYVFEANGDTTWTLVQEIGPVGASSEHGTVVGVTTVGSVGEALLMVGAPGALTAHLYRRQSGTWETTPWQSLTASFTDTAFARGGDIYGDTIAIGDREAGTGGKVEVFELGTTNFESATVLEGSSADSGAHFGTEGVEIDGNFLGVGTRFDTEAFVFKITPGEAVYESNPLRCGSYDSANEQYFYDDGTGCETTPTVNDACYYAAGDLVTTDPATLRVEAGGAPYSRLEADGGEDYIYLSFDLADKYYNMRLVFADAGSGECAHEAWEQVSATRDVTSLDACETTFVYRLPWSEAYNATSPKCGWERDASGENVKLVLDFAVQAVEDLSTMRNGTTITREVEFSMPVEVQFPTQVTASPVNVQVFAPVRALAVVTSQLVTIDEAAVEATLTLDLYTEVQKPFELHAITESTDTMPTGVTLETAMTGVEDEAVRQDDECTDGNADCANTWRWQYSTPSVAGGSNPCDFDGTYQVTFGVRCSDVAETNCPIDDSTDSVEITLSVSTSNHCPTVIDSVDLSAALAVYDLPARVDAQDDFVGDGTQDDGQTADLNDWQVAYFAAPVTSSQVAIDRTEFNQVWIVRHQETVSEADDDVVVLLDADNTIDVSPYDGVGEIDCGVVAGVGGADATATAVSAATGCSPAKDGVGSTYSFNFKHGEGGNSAAGEASTPIFEFDIRTDAAGFAMADDAIEEMQVNAVIDVEYANAAKRTAGTAQNNAQQSTVSARLSMQTTSATGGSGSTALFGMNAMVVYGAGAVLAVVVVAAAVLVMKKPKRGGLEKVESSAEMTATTV